MTRLEELNMELNSINWRIGQAATTEDRQQLEDTYKIRILQILEEIALIKTQLQ